MKCQIYFLEKKKKKKKKNGELISKVRGQAVLSLEARVFYLQVTGVFFKSCYWEVGIKMKYKNVKKLGSIDEIK